MVGSWRVEGLRRGHVLVREWEGGKSGCAWERAAPLFPLHASTVRQPLNPVSLGCGMLTQNSPSRNLCCCSWATGSREGKGLSPWCRVCSGLYLSFTPRHSFFASKTVAFKFNCSRTWVFQPDVLPFCWTSVMYVNPMGGRDYISDSFLVTTLHQS